MGVKKNGRDKGIGTTVNGGGGSGPLKEGGEGLKGLRGCLQPWIKHKNRLYRGREGRRDWRKVPRVQRGHSSTGPEPLTIFIHKDWEDKEPPRFKEEKTPALIGKKGEKGRSESWRGEIMIGVRQKWVSYLKDIWGVSWPRARQFRVPVIMGC